jgi:hypothetical protein
MIVFWLLYRFERSTSFVHSSDGGLLQFIVLIGALRFSLPGFAN